MSVDPAGHEAPAIPPESAPPPRSSWLPKLAAILFCVFCFEMGLFLLLYPWSDGWNRNRWFYYRPEWRPFLLSDHIRGAISGLGILNLLIAVTETFRLRRFARRS
jgi:hypothetical protein